MSGLPVRRVRSKRERAAVRALPLVALALLGSQCEGSVSFNPDDDGEWTWTDLAGPNAPTPKLVSNHETLVVAGNDLLLGTQDGVWRRPIADAGSWERAGLDGRVVNAVTKTADGTRVVAAGFDPGDARAPTVWYSTTGGADWIDAAVWPRAATGGPLQGAAFAFASLTPDPNAANVIYGGLDADSVAVTVDGGATWLVTDGAQSPNFGYPCVAHRPADMPVLLQGCELPLDIAWVAARDIDADDRFTLGDFRVLFGYPASAALGNRRINSIVPVPGRSDRVLVGVEGGLVELTSASGAWTTSDDLEARWVYLSTGGNPDEPYVYVRAIAPLDREGRHVLFGGAVNGENDELMLFETTAGGDRVLTLAPPFELDDPRVEQAILLAPDDLLLVISDVDALDRRSPSVYRLRPGGAPVRRAF